MPYSQQYPWNLYLIKNVENIVVFPGLKVFISDKYFETKSKGEKTIKDINLSSFNIQKWFIVI